MQQRIYQPGLMEREVFGLFPSLTANECPPPKGLLEHVGMQRCLQGEIPVPLAT